MVSLWVGVALLSVLALSFIFWPLVRYGKQQNGQSSEVVADRLAENVRLFHEHIAELEVQLSAGRIDQAQFDQLKLEQERALLDDEADIRAHTVYMTQIGYISMRVDELLLPRLDRIPSYALTFTGKAPLPAEVKAFRARQGSSPLVRKMVYSEL